MPTANVVSGTIQIVYSTASTSVNTFYYPAQPTNSYPIASSGAATVVMPAGDGKCRLAPTAFDFSSSFSTAGSNQYLGATNSDGVNANAYLDQEAASKFFFSNSQTDFCKIFSYTKENFLFFFRTYHCHWT